MTVQKIRASRFFDFLDSALMSRIVLLAVILSLVIGGFATINVERQASKQKELTACLAQYNNDTAKATAARASLNNESIDATTAIITAVAEATSRDDVITAFNTYLTEQSRITTEKKEHPLPPPPSKVCG